MAPTQTQPSPASALVAIALAAFEPKPRFFAQQLQSLVDQTHKNWVCVITFDSSMAEARRNQSIKKFTRDKRFIWRQNRRRLGFAKNFQRAMMLSLRYRPYAIAFCDQDDVWLPAKLQTSLDALQARPPRSLVHCDANVVSQNLQLLAPSNWAFWSPDQHAASVRHLLLKPTVVGASAMFDAQLARISLRVPVPPNTPHDYRVSLVAGLYGGVYPIHQQLYLYRQHAGNVFGVPKFRKDAATRGNVTSEITWSIRGLAAKMRTLHKQVQRGCDRFEKMKVLAHGISGETRWGRLYRSHAFLVMLFLGSAVEYALRGKGAQSALTMSMYGILSLFRRSSMKRLLRLSRQRSAPRRRS
jgi:hypothetical protein